jgi:PhzF family phenazine biosynthesis protein
VSAVRLRTVDAFADRPFTGNPAAVVVLESTPPDEWMAAVARETNLSDTAFVLRERSPDADFRLRWFTSWRRLTARSCPTPLPTNTPSHAPPGVGAFRAKHSWTCAAPATTA